MMTSKIRGDVLSLVNLADGAAVELFNRAMSNVVKNMRDINTTLKPREIILKVKFTPSENRSYFETDCQVKSIYAPDASVKSTGVIVPDTEGRPCAYVQPVQAELPFDVTQMTIEGEA